MFSRSLAFWLTCIGFCIILITFVGGINTLQKTEAGLLAISSFLAAIVFMLDSIAEIIFHKH